MESYLAHHPSAESEVASISRERDGVQERDVWSRRVARHPFRESATLPTRSTKSERLIPIQPFTNLSGTTSRFVQPATSGGVGDDHRNLNLHPEFVFPRGW